MLIDRPTGHVMVRYKNEHGEEKVEDEHMDLPPDLANGMLITLLKNVRRDALPPSVPLLVATPTPRLLKVTLAGAGTESLSTAGSARKATHYVLKLAIGDIAGLVAPLVGKQPPDSHVWNTRGRSPSLREIASADVRGRTGVADGPRESRLAPWTMSLVDGRLVVVSIEDARR